MKIYPHVTDSQKEPKLIQLGRNIFVLSFYVMKLLPALYILRKAATRQLINERTLVVETSSGSFAYGIGLACTQLKLPFQVVSDTQMDSLLQKQLLNQAGKVWIVQKPADKGGIQQARLNRLFEIMREQPNSFWTCQYDNPDNGEAYWELGHQLATTLGEDLMLVGPVGSGGSTCGLISAIREKKDRATLVGVDTFNSVLFAQEDGPRMLPGLGNSILPKNLVHEKFDQVHWVTAAEATAATLYLHREWGLFVGPTTGAAYLAGEWLARNNPDRNVVFISPDMGHRYVETIYNPIWQEKQGFTKIFPLTPPTEARHPREAQGRWSYYNWNRQALPEVLAKVK